MARRLPDSQVANSGTVSQGNDLAGEGNGKTTPTPRPHDSESVIVEVGDAVAEPGVNVNSEHNQLGKPPVPTASLNVYPFGWSRNELRRFVGLSITAVISITFLWYIQSILPPFLLAFFLAALFEPTLRDFERHGRSRVRSILTLYLGALCVVGLVAFIVIPRVASQARDISQNLDNYTAEIKKSADTFMSQHTVLLAKAGIKQKNVQQLLDAKAGPVNQVMGRTLTSVEGAIGGLASRALWLVIIPLTTFFFMRDYPVLRARIITQFPDIYHDRIDTMSREVMDVFSAYLRGLGKICSLYAIVAIALYYVLGLDYALIIGLFAGIFYAVPYVGQLFTAAGTGMIAYQMKTQTILFVFHLNLPQHSIVYTVTVVVIALLVQNIFDQILYPRIVGGSVGLHPVASIFALMAGATLFGIWGMLFAVPVAASIQIIIIYFFPKIRKIPSPSLVNSETKMEPGGAS